MAKRNGGLMVALRIFVPVLCTSVFGFAAWQASAFFIHEKLYAHPVAAAKIDVLEQRDAEHRVAVDSLRTTIDAGFARMEVRHDALAIVQVALDTKQQAILDEVARLRGASP